MARLRMLCRWPWRLVWVPLLLLLLLYGWGTPASQIAAVRDFVNATRRWTVMPEFRDVQAEYVRLGTAATRARVAGLTAGNVMMGIRSVPFLPPSLAANETSQHHYDEFAAGELRAYFRLSEEQGTSWVIESLKALVGDGTRSVTDEELHAFLLNFKTDEPLVIDPGAVQSLRRLLDDVRPATLPANGQDIVEDIRHAARNISLERGWGGDIEHLSPQHQAELFRDLDPWIKAHDPELWRLKQVNDFLNGIWAQTFGQTYARWIGPLVTLWWIARVVGLIWLVAWVWLLVRRRRRKVELAEGVAP